MCDREREREREEEEKEEEHHRVQCCTISTAARVLGDIWYRAANVFVRSVELVGQT